MTCARIAGVAMVAIACCGAASAQTAPVEVRTALSQTAVWLGDRTVYTVELRCAPPFDILLDDLAAARLRVEGGDVTAVREDHEDNADRLIRRFHYTLVTYRVETTELRVAPLTVRYFQRRGGGVQGAPAGQVIVHPVFVAVRSAIPDSEGMPSLRLPETLRPAPRYLRFAQPVGIALIALAIVPVAFLTIDLAGRARRAWGRLRIHRNRRDRVSLEDLDALSPASDAERVEAFDRLDALVREHLADTTGINAPALTPSEIGRALETGAGGTGANVEALLVACERARYAPETPDAESWSDALREAGQVLDTRGRPPSPRLPPSASLPPSPRLRRTSRRASRRGGR